MEPDAEKPSLPKSKNRWLRMADAVEWHYVVNGERRGPVLSGALMSLAEHGLLKPSDLVWSEGMADWVPARRLTGLFVAPATGQSAPESPGAAGTERPPNIENEPMIPFSADGTVGPLSRAADHRPWQFSLKDMLLATALAALGSWAIALVFKADHFLSFGGAVGIVAAPTFFGGAIGVLSSRRKEWFFNGALIGLVFGLFALPIVFVPVVAVMAVLYRRPSQRKETTPAAAIARRQVSIYRMAVGCSVALLVLWLPIIYTIPPGRGCRPMIQLPASVFVILPLSAIGLIKAIYQLGVTWPKKRTAALAILASLAPLAVFALSQWVILSALGIFYED